MAEREGLFTVKMSKTEMSALKKLAKHYAITMSAVVRMLVKRDADAIGERGRQGP